MRISPLSQALVHLLNRNVPCSMELDTRIDIVIEASSPPHVNSQSHQLAALVATNKMTGSNHLTGSCCVRELCLSQPEDGLHVTKMMLPRRIRQPRWTLLRRQVDLCLGGGKDTARVPVETSHHIKCTPTNKKRNHVRVTRRHA